jgi:hypothetical protein
MAWVNDRPSPSNSTHIRLTLSRLSQVYRSPPEAGPLITINSIQINSFIKRITLCLTPHTILFVSHRNKMKKIIVTIFFGFIVIGCVSCAQENQYPIPVNVFMKDMPPTMHFHGFTVYRPLDERWFINTREQNPSGVIFRIENPSPTHTFNASIWGDRIAITPRTKEELKDYVDKENLTTGPRHEILSYESKVSEIQGQWAITYSHKILDKAPSNSNEPLVMTVIGFVVLHPSGERTVIRAYYSQRGKEDELDDALDDIGQSLIDGVVLDSAPGTSIKD